MIHYMGNGQYKRDYRDLEENSDNQYGSLYGALVNLRLDSIEQYVKGFYDCIPDVEEGQEILDKLEYLGAKDFLDEIPKLVQEIRTYVNEE